MENYKNQLIIFSKNRACQLNLLLDSIKENSPLLFDKISVLYKYDNEEYFYGYKKLFEKYPSIEFVNEKNFRNETIRLIDDNIEVTTFMVDDAVIFKKIMARKIDIIKPVVEENFIFSLRLGLNCVYSHPANLEYVLGEHEIKGEYIVFDYTKQQIGDFKYPLSTDGHIFNTHTIKELLIEIDFHNPNTLESNLQRFVNSYSIPKMIKCFIESKLVSIPVNLVNNTFNNRHGLKFGIHEKELNDKFISGETIDLNAMDFSGVNGPHKEIKYEFKNES
jgi:hypothetical protein